MKQIKDTLRLSATDLANHLACRHLSHLDLAAAQGRVRPPDWRPPDVALLAARGDEHEDAFLDHLEKQGLRIARPQDGPDDQAFDRTLAAMREGAAVIAQATLLDGTWFGRADVLRRVARPSRLGAWSYEVWDTKLARETRGGAVLQICLYSDLVGTIQGARPEHMHVVPPREDFEPDTYRVDEFFAYYRLVRRRLESVVGGAASERTYPEPVAHCDVCRWWPECDARRRKDDHLSLVAGISRLQRGELQERQHVGTLEALASVPLPVPWKPKRGAAESYARVREQARIQLAGRQAGRGVYELLPRVEGTGLERLPAPSPGDVFFDLEGDPFVGSSGREYLFGWTTEENGAPRYQCTWALDEVAERAAFESFVDLVMERWSRHPDMHIYHFAPYEPSAVKRIMGRYATRENEVDRMLRAGLFVDLHAVVRQALRASVEEYSIKKLEALYGYEREAPLADAGLNLRIVQRALEMEEPDAVNDEVRRIVEAYNRDDCVSTLRLDRWLETVRADVEAGGTALARPEIGDGAPSEAVDDRDRAVREVMTGLLESLPADRAARSDEEQARWLLAYLLEWHRREEKGAWWEYYRLCDMSDDELLDEKGALSGLKYVGPSPPIDGKIADRYGFPAQETSVRRGDTLKLPFPSGKRFGTVAAIDLKAQRVDVLTSGSFRGVHPTSVFVHNYVDSKQQEASLLRLGRWVAAHGMDAAGPHRSARDLLLGRPPRFPRAAGAPLRRAGETGVAAARRLVLMLGQGTLAIQGPPGTGKTYTGARMICDLVRAGKKVGVCAQSHKVIDNLLGEVLRAADEEKLPLLCGHKDKSDASPDAIQDLPDNARALQALRTGGVHVLGGTSWLWSREESASAADVLFVDEAGQMSLANVLAIAQSAGSLVLLGDPRQLEQPQQGTHPEGTEVSALEHLLLERRQAGDGLFVEERHKTIAEDRGLFLEETWRLHPAICSLTSELFYESRLAPRADLAAQAILGSGLVDGAGLWFLPVAHDGNQSSSPEEVEAIAALVARLTGGGAGRTGDAGSAAATSGVRWRKRDGTEHPLRLEDILIIAPYNAQVADLGARLPDRARVGTVDRFQGQEAPVVLYSMTTSSPADAPRGMEFLYSLNRFNVATSRARCACIVVGSPRLFEPECTTPQQMRLANACCRYLELATMLTLDPRGPVIGPGAGRTRRAARPGDAGDDAPAQGRLFPS
jgi:predicted RecB family nuclease